MSTTMNGTRISPSDVRTATFHQVEYGYDPQAVRRFLQAVSDQLEADRVQLVGAGVPAATSGTRTTPASRTIPHPPEKSS
ncbi:hypothetical protein CTI14_53615 [Methylobacterium radiotolerans]|nr:hypothetical protein CTI14_53615 [Methylobacterium radiotolerans]